MFDQTQEQLDKLKEENSNLNRELKGHKDVLNIQIQSSRFSICIFMLQRSSYFDYSQNNKWFMKAGSSYRDSCCLLLEYRCNYNVKRKKYFIVKCIKMA